MRRIPPPAAGTLVTLRVPNGGTVVTRVVDGVGHLVWFAVPPIVSFDSQVGVTWSGATSGCTSTARVMRSGYRKQLTVALGQISTIERRRHTRFVPPQRILVRAALVGRSGRPEIRGVLDDLSFGGLCFRTSDVLEIGDRIALSLRLTTPGLRPIVESAPASVAWVRVSDEEMTVGCAFELIGPIAISIAGLQHCVNETPTAAAQPPSRWAGTPNAW